MKKRKRFWEQVLKQSCKKTSSDKSYSDEKEKKKN